MFKCIKQWWLRYLVRRAKQCLDAEQWAQAAEYAGEAAKTDGANAEARMVLGLACMKQNDVAGAAEWFASVLAIEPDHVDAKSNLALAYARSKQWGKAMAMVDNLAQPSATEQAEPPSKPGKLTAASAAQSGDGLSSRSVSEIVRAEDWPALRHVAEAALAANPQNGNAMLQLGMALYRMGRADEALVVYDDALDALKKESDRTVVNFNRSMVLMQLGRWGEACRTLESLAMLPREAHGRVREEALLYNLGYCYSQRKMFKMAQATYERLERIDPDYKDVSRCLKNLRVPLAAKATAGDASGGQCTSCSRLIPLGATFCPHCGWTAAEDEQIALGLDSAEE